MFEVYQLRKAGAKAVQIARTISAAPDYIAWENMNFVTTTCMTENNIGNYVMSRGGRLRSSTVLDTNYIIIGNDLDYDSAKVKRAKELIETRDKNIIALTEYEFWSMALKDIEVSEKILKTARSISKQVHSTVGMKNYVLTGCVTAEGINQQVKTMKNVGDKTDCVVIGGASNYDKKVIEKALEIKKKGERIVAMTEYEFWFRRTNLERK